MKNWWTLLFTSAVSFTLLTSMQMSPKPSELKVEITPGDALRVQVAAQNETGKKLHLSVVMLEQNIRSANWETEVYSEEIPGTETDVRRNLNLSKLEVGSYRIKVNAGKESFTRLLEIRSKPTELLADNRLVLFK